MKSVCVGIIFVRKMPVPFTTMRLICHGSQGRLSGQLYTQFDYLPMNKITTIVRNIERQIVGENLNIKEEKAISVKAKVLGVKTTNKTWGPYR